MNKIYKMDNGQYIDLSSITTIDPGDTCIGVHCKLHSNPIIVEYSDQGQYMCVNNGYDDYTRKTKVMFEDLLREWTHYKNNTEES